MNKFTARLIVVTYSLIIATVLMLSMNGCDKASDKNNVHPNSNAVTITSYGNGVYYFDGMSSDVLNALSGFIADHPELELVTISSNQGQAFFGYVVVFREKSTKTLSAGYSINSNDLNGDGVIALESY